MPRVRPILFSGPMVRALLDGRKTQTRRILKPQPPEYSKLVGIYAPGLTAVFDHPFHQSDVTVELPYMPSQLLWVREGCAETWNVNDMKDWPRRPHTPTTDPQCVVIYRADGDWQWCDGDGFSTESSFWKPSIHMPRVWSRLTLEVTAVKVERLQEISEEDAIAEGIEQVDEFPAGTVRYRDYSGTMSGLSSPLLSFRSLWDHLNAGRGFGWGADPWVIALTFTVHRQNVEAVLAARAAA